MAHILSKNNGNKIILYYLACKKVVLFLSHRRWNRRFVVIVTRINMWIMLENNCGHGVKKTKQNIDRWMEMGNKQQSPVTKSNVLLTHLFTPSLCRLCHSVTLPDFLCSCHFIDYYLRVLWLILFGIDNTTLHYCASNSLNNLNPLL